MPQLLHCCRLWVRLNRRCSRNSVSRHRRPKRNVHVSSARDVGMSVRGHPVDQVRRLRFKPFLRDADASHRFLRAALASDCHIRRARRRHSHNDRQRHDHLCWVSCFCLGSSPAGPPDCPVTFTDRQLRRRDVRITRCSSSMGEAAGVVTPPA